MNKKVVLSVLATAVVASMATSAFAKPSQGLYIGGNIDKYYSITEFVTNEAAVINHINSAGFGNVLYVDDQGKAATITEIVNAADMNSVLEKAVLADFQGNTYTKSDGTTYDPSKDPDLGGATGELKVESVSANNLKTVAVELSQAVTTTSATSATVVKLYNGTTEVTAISRSLSADGKTLYLTSNTTFAQLSNLKVVLDGLVSKDDTTKTYPKVEKTFEVKDVTAPEVLGATATTTKTVEINFSEPVAGLTAATKVWDEFYVDGIKAYGTLNVADLNTKNKVVLTLGTALTAGNHTVKVTGLNDHAGFPAATKEFTVSVSADTVAPTIVSASATSRDKVRVEFSEPIDLATVQNGDITIGSYNVQAADLTPVGSDNKVFDISLSTTAANWLSLVSLVETTITYNSISDLNGNAITEAQTFKFTATDDTTAPTVTASVEADNTIKVVFSEKVRSESDDSTGSATNEAHYVLKKVADNTVVPIADGDITVDATDATGKTVLIDLAGKGALSGAYTLEVANAVEDMSVRANKVAKTTLNLNFNDKVAPQIEDVMIRDMGDDATVTISFDAAMNPTTLADKANYIINHDGSTPVFLTDITGSTVSVAADNKSVTITLPDYADGTGVDLDFTAPVSTRISVLAVKDAAGNTLDTADLNVPQTPTVFSSAFGAAQISAKATGKRTVVLEAAEGYEFASIDPNAITFANDGDDSALAGLQVASVSIAADGSSATLTLNQDLGTDASFGAATTVNVEVAAQGIVDKFGREISAVASSDNVAIADEIAPAIVSVDAGTAGDAGKLILTFSENLNSDIDSLESNIAADLTVTLANGTVLDYAAGDYEVEEGTDGDAAINVVIKKDGLVNLEDVVVALTNGRFVKDVNDNRAATFSKALTDGDVVYELNAPAVASATIVNGTTVDIVFAEEVDETTAEAAAYTIATADGADTETLTSATLQADGKTVRLVFNGAVIASGDDVTVPVTVEDLAGNVPGAPIAVNLP